MKLTGLRLPTRILAFSLVCGVALAVNKTWDDGEPADHNWSSPANWNPDGIPVAADVVYFNQTTVGTNYVDVDFTITGLYYDNIGVIHRTVVNDGITLTVSSYLRTGSIAGTSRTNTCAIIAGSGTLDLNGTLQVSGTNSPASLTLDGCRFEVTGLTGVYPGAYGRGILDMTNAVMVSGGATNKFTTTGVFDAAANGVVRLPASVTNIQFGSDFTMLYTDTGAQLNFGMNPQLQTLTFLGNCTYGYGEQMRWNGTSNGIPAGVAVRIGSPGSSKVLSLGTGTGTTATWKRLSRFDAYLSTLQIAESASSSGRGVLDLRGATVVMGGYTNCFRVPTLDMDSVYGEIVELYVPETVTNMTMTNCLLVAEDTSSYGKLVFASNSLLKTFYVANDFTVTKSANIYYIDGAGALQYGFPPGDVTFKVGSGLAASQRGTIVMANASNIDYPVNNLGTKWEHFEIYLDNLTMGSQSGTQSSTTGTMDFRNAELVAFNISGMMRLGAGTQAYGDLYLPSGEAQAGRVELGKWTNQNTLNRTARGRLWMSNTVFIVTNSLEIGAMGQVFANLYGTSGGIDLLTTNLVVTVSNAATLRYGTMALGFNQNPVNPLREYWGFRMKGDQVAYLESLTSGPARLTWTMNGLDDYVKERFGIFYLPGEDVTYVGISPMIAGTVILVR